MTDTKWRSPTGHSISSDVTDKLPPKTGDFLTRGQDDVSEALIRLINNSTSYNGKALDIVAVNRALAQQQPDANKYNTLCKQCWEALGIKDYTGKHIAEHIRELQSALKTLVDLQSNQSGFEGEMFRDRVENAWYNARKLIERAEQKGGV